MAYKKASGSTPFPFPTPIPAGQGWMLLCSAAVLPEAVWNPRDQEDFEVPIPPGIANSCSWIRRWQLWEAKLSSCSTTELGDVTFLQCGG